MIDVIRGANKKENSTAQLVEYLQKYFSSGTEAVVYIGYPILSTAVGGITLDAVLVAESYGIIVFDLVEGTSCGDRTEQRDQLFANMKSKLIQNPELMEKRDLGVSLEVLTFAPQVKSSDDISEDFINTLDLLSKRLDKIKNEKNEKYIRSLISVIQVVTKLNSSRRRRVNKPDSRGAKLKELEESIANLDSRQNRAVIETVDGPQRIRGLAGSGKTIILALKAAYLHSRYPEWDIAITFNTRSLKQQFVDLVTKFTIEQKREDPDWTKLKILQSWGSHASTGIYYEFCMANNVEPLDYKNANAKARNLSPLGYACLTALNHLIARKIEPIQKYDAILIDEAQDLSPLFLKLCYKFLKPPKRIIWAYDELQNLSLLRMQSPRELFGIELSNDQEAAQQDIILDRCYRNSRPVLVTAHGLGFGTVREEGLVQMFDEPSLWKEIGYEVEGKLAQKNKVSLYRTKVTSPPFLEVHSSEDDLIQFHKFTGREEESDWIAEQIEKNLREDELTTRDIVVINLNSLTTKEDTALLRAKLLERDINSHIAGLTTSPDQFFKDDSIAVTGIYRAKGNEAAMVYVMNSEYAYGGIELIKKRNMLFSAITRSRAWVRVAGCGLQMDALIKEFEGIKNAGFRLSFIYPTPEEMQRMRLINRDLTENEKKRKQKSLYDIEQLTAALESGDVLIEDIDPQTKQKLSLLLKQSNDE